MGKSAGLCFFTEVAERTDRCTAASLGRDRCQLVASCGGMAAFVHGRLAGKAESFCRVLEGGVVWRGLAEAKDLAIEARAGGGIFVDGGRGRILVRELSGAVGVGIPGEMIGGEGIAGWTLSPREVLRRVGADGIFIDGFSFLVAGGGNGVRGKVSRGAFPANFHLDHLSALGAVAFAAGSCEFSVKLFGGKIGPLVLGDDRGGVVVPSGGGGILVP